MNSAPDGPTIAIAGGSDTFGIGVPDSGTLPQAFADLTGRRLHVVNLAFSGYGPQQFLRIIETGLDDDILKRPRAFVFPTSPTLAERSACNRGYALNGPRYELVDGKVTFVGTCAERWALPLRWLFRVTSLYDIISTLLENRTPAQKLDLYIAILVRAAQLVREKYGVPTVIFYYPVPDYTRSAGTSDQEVIDRLRAGGLDVIDGNLDPGEFPGQDLFIPGDGHPTVLAHRVRAQKLRDGLSGLVDLTP